MQSELSAVLPKRPKLMVLFEVTSLKLPLRTVVGAMVW